MDNWKILRQKNITPRKKLVFAEKKINEKKVYVVGFRGGKTSYIIDKGTNKDLLLYIFERANTLSPTKLELSYKKRTSPFI
jgi:hypothetical protein